MDPQNPHAEQGQSALEGRLTSVEKELAVLAAAVSFVQTSYATKADVADVRTDIAKLEAKLQRWFIGTVITLITFNAGFTLTVVKLIP